MFFGFLLPFDVLIPFKLCQSNRNDKTTIELFIPSKLHVEIMQTSLEQLPDIFGIFLGVVISSHMYFWDYHLVNYRLWREQLGDLEVMDEEFVALVVEGEVEVDQFVNVEVLKSGVVRNVDATDFVEGDKGSIVVANLWEE